MPTAVFSGTISGKTYHEFTIVGKLIPYGADISSVVATLNSNPGVNTSVALNPSASSANVIGRFTVSSGSYTSRSVSNFNWNLLCGKSVIYAMPNTAFIRLSEVTITVTYTGGYEELVWSSGASLNVVQVGSGAVDINKYGNAVHSGGETVSYNFYCDDNKITPGAPAYLSNSTYFDIPLGAHTFKVVASAGDLVADGPSKTIDIVTPIITWDDAVLSIEQTDQYDPRLNISWIGKPLCNLLSDKGLSLSIIEDDVKTILSSSNINNNSFTYTPTNSGNHSYKLKANMIGDPALSIDAASLDFSIISKSATVKYFNGEEFVECEVYRYVNGRFIKTIPYYYDGSNWVLCSHS